MGVERIFLPTIVKCVDEKFKCSLSSFSIALLYQWLSVWHSVSRVSLRLSNVQVCLHFCRVTVLDVLFLLLLCFYIVYSCHVSSYVPYCCQ